MHNKELTPNPVAGSGVHSYGTRTISQSTREAEVKYRLSPQHQAALELADLGFRVFPLNGKIPIFKGYQTEATREPGTINRWWFQMPFSNIGGMVFKGHVVVDIDPRNGGDTTWEELNEGVDLPTTLTTRTSRGGIHKWFKLPYDLPLRGTAGPGIDLKNSRQFAVLPGAIHPTTGEPYQWETMAPVAMLPDHLSRTVFKPQQKPEKSIRSFKGQSESALLRTVAGAREGERNSLLFWAGCRAYENHIDLDEDLLNVALAIGLDVGEAKATLASARNTVLGVNR